jgi:hypothetical protein
MTHIRPVKKKFKEIVMAVAKYNPPKVEKAEKASKKEKGRW